MRDTLKGKSAIVTGASRGIGQAIAVALAAEGVRLGLLARTRDALRRVAKKVREAGGSAFIVESDLSRPDDVVDAAARLCRQLRTVDFLINNAGVFLERPVTETELADWDYVIRVNLTAPFLLCRAILPQMAARRSGKIINIASTAATQGYLHQSAYCASKHGLLGFARSLALEAKPHNVHVYTLCPGGVKTDLLKGTRLARRLEGQPMINPRNIAEVVVFLLRQPANLDVPEIVIRRFA